MNETDHHQCKDMIKIMNKILMYFEQNISRFQIVIQLLIILKEELIIIIIAVIIAAVAAAALKTVINKPTVTSLFKNSLTKNNVTKQFLMLW